MSEFILKHCNKMEIETLVNYGKEFGLEKDSQILLSEIKTKLEKRFLVAAQCLD